MSTCMWTSGVRQTRQPHSVFLYHLLSFLSFADNAKHTIEKQVDNQEGRRSVLITATKRKHGSVSNWIEITVASIK